jgi:hypothetical protein
MACWRSIHTKRNSARKFIILELKETTAHTLLGLAAITLALGITYWLMRERDDRRLLDSPEQTV